MGSPSGRQPLALHIHSGKSHLTAEAKAAKADAEITMGVVNFSPSQAVIDSPAAFEKWEEITGIYIESGLVLVSSTDNGILSRYCLLHADYEGLVERRRVMNNFDFPDNEMDEILALTLREYDIVRARRLWSILDYYTSVDGVLKLDKAINAKAKAILDVEDRIFLNPASKVKTLPIKRKPEVTDELDELGFGNV